MLFRRCDRCGKFYSVDDTTKIGGEAVNRLYLARIDVSEMIQGRTQVDLCPDCLRHLGAWLEGEEKGI